MRAVVIRGAGGPEVLEIREVPEPTAGPEEVVVGVRATALNRADLLQRRGRYPAPPGAPADIPGLEFAGEVESCGRRVRAIGRGDRVMGILGGGCHAEKVAIHERLCLRIPPAMGWEDAAALPEAFLTAYDALFRAGRLAAGEIVLVEAAGSGVGTAATQLARLVGCRIIGLSRTPAKRARLADLGVAHAFDPARAGLADAILSVTGGAGVDLVIDLVGAAAWGLHAAVLGERGRLVVLGLLGGAAVEIDLGAVLRRRFTVTGCVLRSREIEDRIALVQEFGARILPLFAAGRLVPVVDRVLDLADVAAAHGVLERNESFGKVVLRVGR